ncbi:uncharacterized protein J3D65DRAFT_437518 [Phyllosticta citribraziliensis]|uniref:Uncharacterized protein n=1 Tax=Phyllosticta citribraziliensis TaxID=989973 RepID=A0ABR1LIP3_9PEZI
MSYQNTDPITLAKQAEQDLNSYQAKTGRGDASVSTEESGINATQASRFPGGGVTYGSAATGREIPPEDGGGVQRGTGKTTKDYDFEGPGIGGPEDRAVKFAEDHGGSDDAVRANVREGPRGERKA